MSSVENEARSARVCVCVCSCVSVLSGAARPARWLHGAAGLFDLLALAGLTHSVYTRRRAPALWLWEMEDSGPVPTWGPTPALNGALFETLLSSHVPSEVNHHPGHRGYFEGIPDTSEFPLVASVTANIGSICV